jgi:hypothetical protein
MMGLRLRNRAAAHAVTVTPTEAGTRQVPLASRLTGPY